jgi:hypothetical protein
VQRPVTRLQQGICKPKTYTDGTVCWAIMLLLLQVNHQHSL